MSNHHDALGSQDLTLDTRPSPWSLKFGVWGLMFFSLAFSARAQFSIDWHKIAGGGGTSTNGQFTLSGTIGQHDAGLDMTNGEFSVTGGFWVLPQAVQIEGAPVLTIAPTSLGFATISWTPNTPGFILQETWNLTTANWTNSPSGATNPITLPTDTTGKFFRLRKP
jgi:hypothetical protein